MHSKWSKGLSLLFLTLFGVGLYSLAQATDSRTRTTTTQSQTIVTNNNDCSGFGGGCTGNAATGGVTVNIQGGSLNFDLCRAGMGGFNIDNDLDPPCRVTPPMIPPGADTQMGTGLNPIVVNDAGVANVPFGGPTNDPVPSGSSNVMIPGFLVHGPVGEQTLRCTSTAVCGSDVTQITITHFQNFRSVPSGQVINPANPGVLCDQPRCHHIEFSIDQPMTQRFDNETPFKIDFTIDSKTDSNGGVITATGSWTQTCSGFGCSGNGTFHVVTPFSPNPGSTGFLRIDSSNTDNCPAGRLLDPFHANGVICQ